MMRIATRWAAALILLTAGTGLQAQERIYLLEGDAAGDFFGGTINSVGSLGDTIVGPGANPDFIIGAPGGRYARVFSGMDGSVLGTILPVGGALGDEFGSAVSLIPDSQFMVGAPGGDYALTYFLAGGFPFDSFFFGPADSRFGESIASDLVDTTVVGAPDATTPVGGVGAGQVFYFGTGNCVLSSETTNVGLGFDVAFVGDADDDVMTVPNDFTATTRFGPSAKIYSGDQLTTCDPMAPVMPLKTFTHDSITGLSVNVAGDVDMDGTLDIIIGGIHDAENPGASAIVYNTRTGNVVLTLKDERTADEFFASAVNGAGDANGDGHDDLIVGAFLNNQARVYSGKSGAPLYTVFGHGNRHGFGVSVAPAGDVNLDGLDDVLIGSLKDYVEVRSGVNTIMTGDKIDAMLSAADDIDEFLFPGLKGMGFQAKVKNLSGTIRPQITIFNAYGEEVAEWMLPNFAGTRIRETTLAESGWHRIKIEGRDGTFGDYDIKTRKKLPASAKDRSGIAKGVDNGGLILFKIDAVPGAELNGWFLPKKGFLGRPAAQLIKPDGVAQYIAPYVILGKRKTFKIRDVPLDQLGTYLLWIYGAVEPKSRLKFNLNPNQPKGGGVVPDND